MTKEGHVWPCSFISSLLVVNDIVLYSLNSHVCFFLVVDYFDFYLHFVIYDEVFK